MKKNSKLSLQELDKIFSEKPSVNQKAWGIINDFYHLMLTRMEKEGISKADLAKRLNRTRSAISQMFNKNPNITIKKMVEIADSIGLDLVIIPNELKNEIGRVQKVYVVVNGNPSGYRSQEFTRDNTTILPDAISEIVAQCSIIPKYNNEYKH